MPKIAADHHFVPKFLLAGFTPSGVKEDSFWASDLKTGKQWPTIPKKVAYRRHFNRIAIPGLRPDIIETGLGEMEGYASTVIREILRTRRIPSEPEADYAILMEFTTLMSLRVPSFRDVVNRGVDLISKHALQAGLESPATWKAAIQKARAAGVDIDEETFPYESVKGTCAKWEFALGQNAQIKIMLQWMGKLAPCLAPRKWHLAISESGSLICSDKPVTVRFTRPKAAIDSPGFMREDTEITFPLSRHVLLVGSWEPPSNRMVPLNRKGVAFINGVTLRHCQRFLFSAAKDFCWLDNDAKVRYDSDPLTRAVGTPT